MHIHPLINFPQHTTTVARWIWDEWHDHSELSLAATQERLMDSADCPLTLIALVDDEPAGVLSFRWFQRKSDHHHSLFVDALYIHQPFRGQGIGTALLNEATVRTRHYESDIFVYTDKRDWYEQRGWVLVEPEQSGGFVVLIKHLASTFRGKD